MTEIPKRKRSINIKDARIAGMYDLEKTIGQGHFAVVKLAKHVFTGEMVAVKIIDKANLDPISATHIMQEVRCMKLVQHPNIVRLYEVIDTQTKLFLILELGDYDMHDFILKYEKGCPEPLAQQYFSQIIKAINYCHKLHVVHRDLKPENVVFFEKLGMVKLTDFGFSNLYEPGEQLKTSCGSLAYSAPEILLGDAYDAPAVDVWSLGVILYMLVCGRLPFNEANDSETLTKILDCRYTLPEGLSQACRNLIARMLVRDPTKRATLTEIATSPWVTSGDRGHAEAIPLIERHHLPDSAHTTIVEQMVAGGIGTENAILSALENDEYNYMSATYFLLAERVLATCREERARRLAEKEMENTIPDEDLTDSAEARTGVVVPPTGAAAVRCRSRSNSWRATRRPCSILKEESEEELSSYLRSSSIHSSRNSSPSMSMFSVSARDRVSPQAVQDLLEMTRIANPRRAASPDSVRSSRSPSPPGSSSGRTSPAMSTLSLSRLKGPGIVIGGMRKLSSSPHLLGICEESEEPDLPSLGHSSLLNAPIEGVARTNRSASTGLVFVGRHPLSASKSTGSGQQPTTYSAVRMIRPRQAVVSPDVCKRYEQRFAVRHKRSTSCSSSEASDDEERNRLLLSGSRCTRLGERRKSEDKDDDPSADGGPAAGPSGSSGKDSTQVMTSSEENRASTEKSYTDGKSNHKEAACIQSVFQLRPIPELTHLDSDDIGRPQSRMLERSATAERVVSAWTSGMTSPEENSGSELAESWFSTPPRNPFPIPPPQHWMRALRRTKSHEALSIRISDLDDQEEFPVVSCTSSLDLGVADTSLCSSSKESLSDSGCSAERCKAEDIIEKDKKQKRQRKERGLIVQFDSESDYELRDLSIQKIFGMQDCYDDNDKVDAWLRSANFELVSQ